MDKRKVPHFLLAHHVFASWDTELFEIFCIEWFVIFSVLSYLCL